MLSQYQGKESGQGSGVGGQREQEPNDLTVILKL